MHSGQNLYISAHFSQTQLYEKLKKTLHTSGLRDTPVLHVARVGTTLMRGRIGGQTAELRLSRRDRPGKTLAEISLRREKVVLETKSLYQPRPSSHKNDNYCVTKLHT